MYRTDPGEPFPLGAVADDTGVNFALFSDHASGVELCLYSQDGSEKARIDITHQTHGVWHVRVHGLTPGSQYGYRVHGPYDPAQGMRFNPHKLLLDPYARAITGDVRIQTAHYGFRAGDEQFDPAMDTTDSAPLTPKCIVTGPPEAGPAPLPVRIPWDETQIYELHVKGFTQLMTSIPEAVRGKYLGLAEREVANYLRTLGVTSVEILPVQYFADEPSLTTRGLVNYWGYNTLNFFTPAHRYARRDPVTEFRTMVAALHDAGIEVIADVVYNHTAEGNHLGPTLCYRGIDNLSYYRLADDDPRKYVNDSGCGNTLNANHPRVVQLITDSLRYWVTEMGVDGFRFDLATTLGREGRWFNPNGALFKIIAQDPILERVKLIAEPWDLGPGGYQLGQFPRGWSEWNDCYRDCVRRFWRGDEGMLRELARYVHGGSHLFEHASRTPHASINMITSHDGFTLHDLVTYSDRNNHDNGESNHDGHTANYSFNHGVEGPTSDPVINALRRKQSRNLQMTLAVSQGVPMYLAGDEIGNTQQGNNNAFCQDNPIGWIDWGAATDDYTLEHQTFVREVIGIRARFAELRLPRYVHHGVSLIVGGENEILWYHPTGRSMVAMDWHDPSLRTVGLLLNGRALSQDDREASVVLVLFNGDTRPVSFNLPHAEWLGRWEVIESTANERILCCYDPGVEVLLEERSMMLLTFEERRST